jgi:hypothetical protein
MSVEEQSALPVAPDVLEESEPQEEAQPVVDRREEFQHSKEPESVHDVSYHPGEIVFYCHVTQRQKWGDSQILPRYVHIQLPSRSIVCDEWEAVAVVLLATQARQQLSIIFTDV